MSQEDNFNAEVSDCTETKNVLCERGATKKKLRRLKVILKNNQINTEKCIFLSAWNLSTENTLSFLRDTINLNLVITEYETDRDPPPPTTTPTPTPDSQTPGPGAEVTDPTTTRAGWEGPGPHDEEKSWTSEEDDDGVVVPPSTDSQSAEMVNIGVYIVSSFQLKSSMLMNLVFFRSWCSCYCCCCYGRHFERHPYSTKVRKYSIIILFKCYMYFIF